MTYNIGHRHRQHERVQEFSSPQLILQVGGGGGSNSLFKKKTPLISNFKGFFWGGGPIFSTEGSPIAFSCFSSRNPCNKQFSRVGSGTSGSAHG